MNHIIIDELHKCYGCRSCENICPQKAITMIENEEGFLYPSIDENKCNNCGLCKKICCYFNDIDRSNYLKEPVCYGAKAINKDTQKNSTSGGVFAVIAKNLLKNNGIVVGSEMSKELKVQHVIIDNIEDLNKIMGSKYVCSDLGNIFIQIKKYLDDGKEVLFSGVPCQIAALINYLQKPYSNLITAEVICHGTPPQKLFDRYIEYLEDKYSAKITSYQFRSKEVSKWGTYKSLAEFSNSNNTGFKKAIDADFDKYYNNFLNCNSFRESCYKCKFATTNRNADFTLGDFWGVEHINPELIDNDGLSVVVLNTDKAVKIFDSIKNELSYDEVNYSDVQKYNGQLKSPSNRPSRRNTFFNNIDDSKYFENVKADLNFKSYIKKLVPQGLKLKLKSFFKR